MPTVELTNICTYNLVIGMTSMGYEVTKALDTLIRQVLTTTVFTTQNLFLIR